MYSMIKIAKDRLSTFSLKHKKYEGKDILPLWVADSEFECAPAIKTALAKRVEHGVFGYHNPYQFEPGVPAIQRWLLKQYNWQVKPEWIVWTPGVVPAFNMMCQAFCKPGDGILVQSPNYPPLLNAPVNNGFMQETVSTHLVNGRWQLDFDELEAKASKPTTTLFLLCNPMNPCGSVLTEQELQKISDICNKHNVLVCSDEIHADLVLDKTQSHIPVGCLPNLENTSVTLMAASKTFNVAGFGVSFAIIPDAKLRKQFQRGGQGIAPSANNFGVIATTEAFTKCDDWYESQLDYLRDNQALIVSAVNLIDGIEYTPAPATYLAWIDCRKLHRDELQSYMESLGLGPSPGADFGCPGFIRINFACSREMLTDAMTKLQKATKQE